MYPLLRILRAGVLVALAVGVAGWTIERARFGATVADATARVERDVRQQIDGETATLSEMAAQVAALAPEVSRAERDQSALRTLFDRLADEVGAESGRTGITVYDTEGSPLAWAGRVSDLPRERVQFTGARAPAAALLAAPGALGPRLIRIVPAADAAIVVERSLGADPAPPGAADHLTLQTALAPVTVTVATIDAAPTGDARAPAATNGTSAPSVHAFTIAAPDGAPLLAARVELVEVSRARDRWDHLVGAAVLAIFAVTLLLCVPPLVDDRRRVGSLAGFAALTIAIVIAIVGARAVAWFAAQWIVGPQAPDAPVELLLTALATAALAWMAIDLVQRRPLQRPRPPLLPDTPLSIVAAVAVFAVAGIATGAWLWVYERAMRHLVSHSTLDLLHFSLHPINGTRLALTCGLVVLHAAAIWSAAAFALLAEMFRRTPRAAVWRTAKTAGWIGGALLATLLVNRGAPVPVLPLWVAIAVAGAAALTLVRVSARLRRASQAARLATVYAALLAPSIAMYPSIFAFAVQAKEQLVATEYGPEAASQREDLERRMLNSLGEIDRLAELPEFVAGGDVDTPTTDRAFVVWSDTDLARARLTSAIELFNGEGRLVSRFALNLPEYSASAYAPHGCSWEEIVDEVSPFGSSERHVLRTSRDICEHGRVVGGIVVRAMLDPRTLPFISSQSPYLESLRLNRQAPLEGVFGRDIELVMYGWSRAPTYADGTSVWPLSDDVFQRLVDSREPLWATVERNDATFRVYFLSDRGGIYALGYPVVTWLGHLINLSELVLLAGVLYIVALAVGALFSALTLRTPTSGRALLREVRSSFYMKLFLAFVASVVVPVAILAAATRTYFANQLFASAEEAAAKTVTTAQRLVEDYATLQQRGGSLTGIEDPIMVLVSRAIDEDVNLFDRQHLQATSARDLFASQLLSSRTPADVYRRVLLDRLPTFVGDERVGNFPYRLTAAPVRAGGREGVITVPMTNRQQDIEQQIDELDRRVLSGALLFSLLGAALGYWMAERIADPVNRLTRATRRIARGDLDARIAATSSDELRRLVDDFNQMAADLKRQRIELERTQRLEAWADMARQVAHDIKNPLTPIQLSAEHARRVNIDRGRPLSPVLDECVNTILGQVTLLRQISAEFSSFASSPTPRPEPTDLAALIQEAVEPYRTGLAGRITIVVDAAPDLPVVSVDRTLFARALINVIENALHAMPGRGTLTITSRGATLNEQRVVVVEVSDTGVGMDADALAKIFEPYFSTKATGTGLGLTIAKRNVELNGGTIAVSSQRGVGTTVTVVLPA
ncbi:MAG TPA: ATP-binding protein [Vicinamibacterales bacterium]|nr:ATP-binding protein [Vicinamibacterales bacterium]